MRRSIVLAIALAASPAQAVIIDDFTSDQAVLIPTPFVTERSNVLDDAVLGGEREIAVSTLQQGIASAEVDEGALTIGINTFTNGPDQIQNITELTYDGVDGSSSLDRTNAFDLTDGGLSDRFIFEGFLDFAVLLIGGGAPPLPADLSLTARVFGETFPDAASATQLISLPLDPTPVQYEILFGDLQLSNPTGNVSVSSAGAVGFRLSAFGSSVGLRIDRICTGNAGGCVGDVDTPPVSVPEPTTLALLGLGLAGLGLIRRRNQTRS